MKKRPLDAAVFSSAGDLGGFYGFFLHFRIVPDKLFTDSLFVKHDPLRHFPYIVKDYFFESLCRYVMGKAYRLTETHMVAAVKRIFIVSDAVQLHFTAAVGAIKKSR